MLHLWLCGRGQLCLGKVNSKEILGVLVRRLVFIVKLCNKNYSVSDRVVWGSSQTTEQRRYTQHTNIIIIFLPRQVTCVNMICIRIWLSRYILKDLMIKFRSKKLQCLEYQAFKSDIQQMSKCRYYSFVSQNTLNVKSL